MLYFGNSLREVVKSWICLSSVKLVWCEFSSLRLFFNPLITSITLLIVMKSDGESRKVTEKLKLQIYVFLVVFSAAVEVRYVCPVVTLS